MFLAKIWFHGQQLLHCILNENHELYTVDLLDPGPLVTVLYCNDPDPLEECITPL